jgi:hypothetical protein
MAEEHGGEYRGSDEVVEKPELIISADSQSANEAAGDQPKAEISTREDALIKAKGLVSKIQSLDAKLNVNTPDPFTQEKRTELRIELSNLKNMYGLTNFEITEEVVISKPTEPTEVK